MALVRAVLEQAEARLEDLPELPNGPTERIGLALASQGAATVEGGDFLLLKALGSTSNSGAITASVSASDWECRNVWTLSALFGTTVDHVRGNAVGHFSSDGMAGHVTVGETTITYVVSPNLPFAEVLRTATEAPVGYRSFFLRKLTEVRSLYSR